MRLVIGAQNVGKGAAAMDHHPDFPEQLYEADRWSMIVKRFADAPRQVDVLVLNELNGWGEDRLAAAAADLGMASIGIARSASGYATGFLYRPSEDLRCREFNVDHDHAWHHGGAVAAFHVAGLPQPVAVVGAHLWPADSDKAAAEAAAVVYRAVRYGGLGVYAGDVNFAGLLGPAMDQSKMQPHNMMARMINPPPAFGPLGRARNRALKVLWIRPRPNTKPARRLYDGGMRDAAEVMYLRTRTLKRRLARWRRAPQRPYLAYTCPSARIDIIAATTAMTAGLHDFWVLERPHGASDHAAVIAEFDTNDFDLRNLEPYY